MPRKPTDNGRPRRPFKPRDRDGARPDGRTRDGARAEVRGPRPPRKDDAARKSSAPKKKFAPRTDSPPRDRNRVPRPVREDTPPPPIKERERVAKVIARAGLASRREVEEWIAAGRVAVNGETLTTPAVTVGPDDRIAVDGVPLPDKERTRLFMFHKPKGYVTTTDDPEGRPTVFDLLPAGLPRLVSVGRLDLNTEGLLLLTNDGGLARILELPETGWLRRYRVRAWGEITQPQLDGLREGIEIDGFRYGAIEATLDREQGSNVWMTVALREGKKREIRTVLTHLGVEVNRLIRVSFGPFQLGELAEGGVEEVKTRVLKEQIGERLAQEAGCDFDAPVREHGDDAKREVRAPQRRDERPRREDRPRRDERPRREDGAPRGDRPPRGRPGETPRFGEAEEPAAKPLRRGRRRVNIWRAPPEADATLTRKPKPPYRRHERGEAPPSDRPKTTGLVADRKGRRVLVERIARSEAPPAAPARERPRRDDRPPRRADRPHASDRGERRFGDKARDDRPRGDRPRGARPFGDKPYGDRPRGERSFGGKPFGDKPRGERPFADKRSGDRPREDRPRAGKPGGRPFGGKPSGSKPFGGKPRGPRRPRSE